MGYNGPPPSKEADLKAGSPHIAQMMAYKADCLAPGSRFTARVIEQALWGLFWEYLQNGPWPRGRNISRRLSLSSHWIYWDCGILDIQEVYARAELAAYLEKFHLSL